MMTTKELFEFITDPTIEECHIAGYLQNMAEMVEKREQDGETLDDVSDEVRILNILFNWENIGVCFSFSKKSTFLTNWTKLSNTRRTSTISNKERI